jgi:hypothetical protein
MSDVAPVPGRRLTGSRVQTRTAASLAKALANLRFDDLPRGGATRLVTRATITWADELGWLAVPEMPLAFLAATTEQPSRQGIVDLYIARPGYRRDLVVEIDRGNKQWSAQKLGHAVEHGRAAIWVRWSGPPPRDVIVPAGVEVVYLEVGGGTRIAATNAQNDIKAVSEANGLSGASRALLAGLYTKMPELEPGWQDETTMWQRVDALHPRLALIVRCRFGRHSSRPLTLARTAEVVSEEFGGVVVTRERIRQLQAKAFRQLRARFRIAVGKHRMAEEGAAQLAAREAVPSAPVPPPMELRRLITDLVRAYEGDDLRASMICHILRGSSGPKTRVLVQLLDLPHYDALPKVSYRPLYEAVLAVSDEPPLVLDDGRVRLRRPHADVSASGQGAS